MGNEHTALAGIILSGIAFLVFLGFYIFPREKTKEHRAIAGAFIVANFCLVFMNALLYVGEGLLVRGDGQTIFPVRWLTFIIVYTVILWASATYFWFDKFKTQGTVMWGILFSAIIYGLTLNPSTSFRWGFGAMAIIAGVIIILMLLGKRRNEGWIDIFAMVWCILCLGAYFLFWGLGEGTSSGDHELYLWLLWVTDLCFAVIMGLLMVLTHLCSKPEPNCKTCGNPNPCSTCSGDHSSSYHATSYGNPV